MNQISVERIGEIVAALDDYDALPARSEDRNEDRDEVPANVWADVIENLPEYDRAATDAVDVGDDSRIVLTDGSQIRYDAERGEWVAQFRL